MKSLSTALAMLAVLCMTAVASAAPFQGQSTFNGGSGTTGGGGGGSGGVNSGFLAPQGDVYYGPNNSNGQSSYLYVGGLAGVPFGFMPVNTTIGDVTAKRLFVGNTAAGQDNTVLITGSPASASGTSNFAQYSATVSPTANSSAAFRALYSDNLFTASAKNLTASGLGASSAVFGENRVTALGTVTALNALAGYGLTLSSQATSLGTVTTLNGLGVGCLNSFSNSLTTTITGCYGSHIYAPINSGSGPLTLTGAAGIDIENITQGTNNTLLLMGTPTIPTGNFGIYSSSTSNNYLNGNLGIGTTSPQSMIHAQAGEVQVGSSGASCAAANAGAVRYSSTNLSYCNASSWTTLGTGAGTVNSGTQYQLGYYATTSSAISGNSTLTTDASNNLLVTSGSIGVGTASPQSKVHVQGGEVQIGSSGAACGAATAGALRYSAGTAYYCNASVWTAFGTSSDSITAASSNIVVSPSPITGTGTIDLGAAITPATSVTSPLHIGGTTASSSLSLESTSGAGTTDYIAFLTGSQAEKARIGTAGALSIGTTLPVTNAKLNIWTNATAADVVLGVWGSNTNYNAIGLAGSLAAGQAHIYSSASDKNLYLNAPTGSKIRSRINDSTVLELVSTGITLTGSQTTSGSTTTNGILSNGTKFTTSGCSISSTTGGATAGKFTLGANTCTAVVTMNGATGLAASNGWACSVQDITAPTIFVGQSASTTTTASFSVPVTAGATDVITFACTGY